MFEEFDYSLENYEQNRSKFRLKKIVLVISALFIVSLFFYIIFNAYRYMAYRPSVEDVSLVRAKIGEIKVMPSENQDMQIDNLDMSVYDVLENGDKKSGSKNQKILKVELEERDEVKLEEKGEDANKSNFLGNITIQEKPINILDKPVEKEKSVGIPHKRAQISALQTRDGAEKYWKKMLSKHSSLLADKEYFIEEADLGDKGKFYRLQVGIFKSLSEVQAFCDKYVKLTNTTMANCIVIDID